LVLNCMSSLILFWLHNYIYFEKFLMDAMAHQISQIVNLFGKCRQLPPIGANLWNILWNQKYPSWVIIEMVILQCHTMSYHVNYLTNSMDLVYEWIKNENRWVNTTYVFHCTLTSM
jgi:hypothetical protein